jgi:DNA adenine methylase
MPLVKRDMTKHKSPISWMGGKSRLVKTLLPLLPEHKGYIEVFGGAGHLLFGKDPSKWEVLNDLDGNLMNFWAVVKTAPDQLISSFDYTLVSRRTFDEYKKIYAQGDYDDCIRRAHIFYYLVRAGFGAKMDGPTFGTGRNRNRLHIDEIERDIMQAYERLQAVTIENVSFERILRTYDEPDSLFFMDPPYHGTAQYKVGAMSDEKYGELADMCGRLKGRFLLTINDDDFTRRLFSGFNVRDHGVQYSIGKEAAARHEYGELIVCNY